MATRMKSRPFPAGPALATGSKGVWSQFVRPLTSASSGLRSTGDQRLREARHQ